MKKDELRLILQKRLLKITSELRKEKSQRACKNLISMPEFQNASTIMMYLSLPTEADTTEAILQAWQLKKIVAAPKVLWQQQCMEAVKIDSLEKDFSIAVSGLRNPVKGIVIPFESIDLIVVPALGFDRQGNRLGRGGGYYDRFLANKQLKAPKCGFAFAEQLVDAVPVTEYDKQVDFLVTDEEVIHF